METEAIRNPFVKRMGGVTHKRRGGGGRGSGMRVLSQSQQDNGSCHMSALSLQLFSNS
jgi:hypothetical protein